jgi:rhomboid protease GluP
MHLVLYLCAAAVVLAGSQVLIVLTGFGPLWHVARLAWRRPVPPVAAGLVALLTVMAVAQAVHPAIVGALEREPHGGWWRDVTGLLVQSSGWFQLVFNLAALVAVAPVAARTLGNTWTLVVYLVAGVAAQAVSTAGWSPRGGGDSVAICGLVGALAVGYLIRGGHPALRRLAVLVPAAGVVLCLLTNNHGVGVVVGSLFGVLLAVRPGPAAALAAAGSRPAGRVRAPSPREPGRSS